MNVPVRRFPSSSYDVPLEQRGARAVREAAAHLALDEQRVEQPARVVHGHVVEDSHRGRSRAIDLDDGDVGDEAVRAPTRRRGRPRPAASRFGAA